MLANTRGQTLVSAMLAVALVSLLALFSATAIQQISQALHRNDQESRVVALDADVANLLALPQVCSCIFANPKSPLVSFTEAAKSTTVIDVPSLDFYADSTCTNKDPMVVAGKLHDASQAMVTSMKLGPFHPLGNDGSFLADLTITVQQMARPMVTKVLLSAPINASGNHVAEFCGPHLGSVTTLTQAKYSKNQFYRYSQLSLNFACPGPATATSHSVQAEPYVFTRTQYFWPVEEGDFITEFEQNRLAGGNVAPVAFSVFAGATTCYEENSVGDSVRLIVPSINEAQCEPLKQQFLAAGAAPIDVGFSLVDNCLSRF